MFAVAGLDVILQLVVILGVVVEAEVAAAARESTLDDDGGAERLRGLAVAVADILEAGFVEEVWAVRLGVAELEDLLGVVGVVGLGREGKLADAGVGLIRQGEVVADAESLDFAELPVVTSGEIGVGAAVGVDLRKGRLIEGGVEDEGVDDGVVGGAFAPQFGELRRVFGDGTVMEFVSLVVLPRCR